MNQLRLFPAPVHYLIATYSAEYAESMWMDESSALYIEETVLQLAKEEYDTGDGVVVAPLPPEHLAHTERMAGGMWRVFFDGDQFQVILTILNDHEN